MAKFLVGASVVVYLIVCAILILAAQTTNSEVTLIDMENPEQVKMSRKERDLSPESNEAILANATTQFGLNFINKLTANEISKNVVISPLSIQTVLNMLLLGSRDKSATQSELDHVLNYHNSSISTLDSKSGRLEVHNAAHRLMKSVENSTKLTTSDEKHLQRKLAGFAYGKEEPLPSDPQVLFSLANLLLTNEDLVNIKSDYESELKKYYDAKVEKFSKKNIASLADRVNDWTKAATHNMIDKIVDKADFEGADLVSVLINAVYMRGRWLHTFNKKNTREETFFNDGKTATTTNFMVQEESFGYADLRAEKLNCQVVSLPFTPNNGKELSMLILLPAEKDGISKLQSALDLETLQQIYQKIGRCKLDLHLPRFTFEATFDARTILSRMGLKSLFNNSADLDRMFSSAKKDSPVVTRVDKLIHKAKITVDEVGAEAAAVTVARMVMLSYFVPTTVKVDHPFLFIIRQDKSNLPLFIGRVNKL